MSNRFADAVDGYPLLEPHSEPATWSRLHLESRTPAADPDSRYRGL